MPILSFLKPFWPQNILIPQNEYFFQNTCSHLKSLDTFRYQLLELKNYFQTLIPPETFLTSSHINNFYFNTYSFFIAFFPSYDLYFLKMAKNTLHLEKEPKYYQKIVTENSSLYTWGRVYGLGKIPSGKSLSFCASIFTPGWSRLTIRSLEDFGTKGLGFSGSEISQYMRVPEMST